ALEDSRAQAHELTARSLIDVVLGLPGAPRRGGVLDSPRDVVRGERLGSRSLGRRPLQRKPHAMSLRDREAGAYRRVLDRGLDACADDNLIRASDRPAAALGGPEQRLDQPVLGSGSELELEVHLAGQSLDESQDQVRSSEPELVMTLTLSERHR